MATAGHNNPPTPAEIFQPQIDTLIQQLMGLLAQPTTAEVAAQLRDVVKRASDLDAQMKKAKEVDKRPHLDANIAIEDSYRGLSDDALRIKADARRKLDAFLLEEEKRREREAKTARDEAAKAQAAAAAKAAEATENPFTAREADNAQYEAAMADHAATHAERRAESGPRVASAAGLGRATSLRSYWSAKITDHVAAATHFANDPGVKIAVQKAADAFARATKGTQPIPGCELKEDRRSA